MSLSGSLVSLINEFKDDHKRKLEDNSPSFERIKPTAGKLDVSAAAQRRKMEKRKKDPFRETVTEPKVLGRMPSLGTLGCLKERDKKGKSYPFLAEDSERQIEQRTSWWPLAWNCTRSGYFGKEKCIISLKGQSFILSFQHSLRRASLPDTRQLLAQLN